MTRAALTAERRPIIIVSGPVDTAELELLGATVIEGDNALLLITLVKHALGIDPDAPSWAELQLERAIWGRR